MNRFQVRPATTEDLPQLRPLWEVENLPGDELEGRIAEFQVVVDEAGQIQAAIGLEEQEGQGKLHSESIVFLEHAEAMRMVFWPRIENLARNRGLTRLWTCLEAPFWKGVGFKKVTEDTLALWPAGFAEENANWLTMPLKSVETGPEAIDKQFAVLKAMSQAENERLMERAKWMKMIALVLLVVISAAFALWVLSWVKVRRELQKRRDGRM